MQGFFKLLSSNVCRWRLLGDSFSWSFLIPLDALDLLSFISLDDPSWFLLMSLSLESYSIVSGFFSYIDVLSVQTGGGRRFLIGDNTIIPLIWHGAASLNTVFILENLVLYNSLNIYPMITVLWFGKNPLSQKAHHRETDTNVLKGGLISSLNHGTSGRSIDTTTVDIAASDHAVNDRSLFQTLNPNDPIVLELSDRLTTTPERQGTVLVQLQYVKRKLRNLYFVQELSLNVFLCSTTDLCGITK